jgi:heme/copper-type cytochrome/quinol oxidase subunit 1
VATHPRQALPTWRDGAGVQWLTAVDHRRIGLLYTGCGVVLLALLGIASLLLALDLAQAPRGLLGGFGRDQLHVLQGTAALFAVGLPIALGLACYLVPLQLGTHRLVLGTLNALGFWLWLGGTLLMLASPAAGNAETATAENLPNPAAPLSPDGQQFWLLGLVLLSAGALLTCVSILATVTGNRAPGLTAARLPVFTWAAGLFAAVVVFWHAALIVIAAIHLIDPGSADAFTMDAGTGFYANGVWFLAHPLTYALLVPALAALAEAVPVLTRRPLASRALVLLGLAGVALVAALVALAHLVADGLGDDFVTQLQYAGFVVVGPAALVALALLPSLAGIGRHEPPASPVVLALGAIELLALGTVLGLVLGLGTIDEPGSYHLTAHFAGTLGGVTVLGLMAAVHYWFPKLTGRLLDARMAVAQAGMTVVGLNALVVGGHVVGESNLARLVASGEVEGLSNGAKVGASVALAGTLLVFFGLAGLLAESAKALRSGVRAGSDPWRADTLEWLAASPPTGHDFDRLPPVTSARPLADLRERLERTRPGSRG